MVGTVAYVGCGLLSDVLVEIQKAGVAQLLKTLFGNPRSRVCYGEFR
jgi:hypothetical protein